MIKEKLFFVTHTLANAHRNVITLNYTRTNRRTSCVRARARVRVFTAATATPASLFMRGRGGFVFYYCL